MARYLTENKDIGQLVREAESAFTSGGGTLMSKYVTTDLYSDINRIYAYLESKHISGDTDSLGRDKPFFNIVIAARNIYYRATDIDRKNIEVKATKSSDTVPAFLATVHLQNWMRKENYGAFLNDWGMELAAFNSAVVKHVESNGELHPMVVPWSRLIVDQVNFDANPKIEILELTQGELKRRVKTHGYDKKIVYNLCDSLEARETTDGQEKDQKANYIKLYEVHGLFPVSYLTGKDKDADKFEQQMHVISFLEGKEEGEYDDYTLVSGRESRDPYMLTSLLPATDGSISLNGAVKNLFDAQWMMNHTVKSIKDQRDVASKLIFQTADGTFVGRNVLSAIEQGDILIHAVNMPLTQVNNGSHDIASQQNFGQMWKTLSAEINGISESMLGMNPPAGTAWALEREKLQESHSLFELMTENKALAIEKMLRTYVIPHLKKKMDTADEIGATLEAHNITKIDSMYIPAEAARRYNRKVIEDLIGKPTGKFETLYDEDGEPYKSPIYAGGGKIPSPYQPDVAQQEVKAEMTAWGNQRFFVPDDVSDKTWKDVVKDLEWELEVNISGEAADKQTILTTLSTALQAVANPLYATNPQAQLVVSKILSATGVISPLELAAMPPPTPPVQPSVGPPAQGLPAVTQQ